MRAVRLVLAAAAVAGSFAVAPAQAQPCVNTQTAPVDVPQDVNVCVLPDSWYRGVAVIVFGQGYVLVGEGCYYPGGQPHYFVHVATSWTGSTPAVTIPVAAPVCV